MDEQQQELAAFESSLRGEPVAFEAADPAPAAVSEAEEQPGAPEVAEPAADAAPAVEIPTQVVTDGDKPAEQPTKDDDPEVFEGFKRSEIKRLVQSASEVESLKLRLRKAEGKVGELNSRLLQPQAAQPPAPIPALPVEVPEDMKQFEQDYPDIARYIKAHGLPMQPLPQVAPPAAPHAPVAAGEAVAQAELDPMAVELAVMDHMHKGWLDKLQSEPFGMWLAAQGDEVKRGYASAQTAAELSAVIGQYDQWSAGRQAAADRAAKGQQRLQKAVTPTGNAPRPQAAMTEQEAFETALRS